MYFDVICTNAKNLKYETMGNSVMIGNSKWKMESDLKSQMSVIHIVRAAQYTALIPYIPYSL